MPLITCPECQKQVSDKAAACPQCGAPITGVAAPVQVGGGSHARVTRTGALWEGCVAPVVDLPTAYAIEGAGIAWVDRTYDCSGALVRKGRFEPASSLSLAEV